MDKREAYRLVYVYPDKVLEFEHYGWKGTITKDIDSCYMPFTCEVEATKNVNGIYYGSIGRRYRTVEDAVVHIWNCFNENAHKKNEYNSLEDVIIGK